MEYRAPTVAYTEKVREVTFGTGDKTIKVGGENKLPLHSFDEGSAPNPPRLALEVYDMKPTNWSEAVLEPFKDVASDPVEWAKKCIRDFGADSVCLKLVSTSPAEKDSPPEQAAQLAKKMADAIPAGLIVYGTGDEEKDAKVLPAVAEACDGQRLLIGPAIKENYEVVGKAILEHGHVVIAQSPLDINLMKELNVRLCHTFPPDRIVIDPLSSGLGYGFEYSFTLMERTKQIGIIHGDGMTQMPIIADLATECWKTKQAKENEKQGLLWEGMTALSLLMAGANILILRHPETLKLIREMVLEG